MKVKIAKGDVLVDNDPRAQKRQVRVVSVTGVKVLVVSVEGGHRSTVGRARIFDDGKARRFGFSVLRPERYYLKLETFTLSDEQKTRVHRFKQDATGMGASRRKRTRVTNADPLCAKSVTNAELRRKGYYR